MADPCSKEICGILPNYQKMGWLHLISCANLLNLLVGYSRLQNHSEGNHCGIKGKKYQWLSWCIGGDNRDFGQEHTTAVSIRCNRLQKDKCLRLKDTLCYNVACSEMDQCYRLIRTPLPLELRLYVLLQGFEYCFRDWSRSIISYFSILALQDFTLPTFRC